MTSNNDNMKIYNQCRAVPPEALKPITGGRLKGMTDINPMWRIQKLTEMFGACGIGWWYEITEKHVIDDEITHQKAAFVDIALFYKNPDTGEVSHPVYGTGGASLVAQEQKGAYLSDEGFKMALTDALSIAAKALGVGADVWFAAGRDKYTAQNNTESDQAKPTQQATKQTNNPQQPLLFCDECEEQITKAEYDFSNRVYGKHLCRECQKKSKKV